MRAPRSNLAVVFSVALGLGMGVACFRASPEPSTSKNNASSVPSGSSPATEPSARAGSAERLEPGVLFREDTLSRGGASMRVWFYTPEAEAPPEGRGVVLIAPAGSNFLSGMRLGLGDRPEHLPYVRAGFIVVSYDIDGALSTDDPSEEEFARALIDFYSSALGVANARAALDHALRQEPGINPNRIFVAGHSSAATLALQVGALDKRVDGVVAYAPVTDFLQHFAELLPIFDAEFPAGAKLLRQTSPLALVDQMSAPVFLFHSQKDSVVSVEESRKLAEALRAQGKTVTYEEVHDGDHYDSMIKQGVVAGIRWLRSINSAK